MLCACYQNYDFKPQIEYIFDVIFSIYGIKYQITDYQNLRLHSSQPSAFTLSYGKERPPSLSKKHIHIYESDLFGKNYLKANSMPEAPLKKCDNLSVIYSGHGDFDGWVRKSESLIETNIDIIASCFFMLSRYEEIVLDIKDEHERFPATASLAYKQGFLDRPIVNEYAELLWSWIKSLKPELTRKPLWPEDKKFAVCLTHDIDSLKKYSLLPPVISMESAILRQKKVRLGFKIASDYLGTLFHLKKDPFDTFTYMLDLEQNYGFKSSFYFMAGGNSKFDSRYSIAKPKVMKLISQIEDKGCEIGIHPSYNSYNSLENMASEKERLDKVVSNKSYGCRQHYVRWKTPDTWQIQEKAGLMYDTTLSFADHTGFKCGICLPFQPFDVIQNRRLNIWELPLTVMERSLQSPIYQNLTPDAAYEEIIKYIETIKRFNGVFVLLWHNSSFDPLGGWAGWKEVYEGIMEYINKQNAFVKTGRAITEMWQESLAIR